MNAKTTSSQTSPKSPKALAEDTADAAQDAASSLRAKAGNEASKLASQARQMADAKVEEGKAQATSQIDRTAEQIRNAGHEFGDDSYQA